MTVARLAAPSMRQRFTDTVSHLLDIDRRAVILTADIGAGGFYEAARRHPHRVINVGIREQLLIGTAAGFALEGFRPIVHSYAPFLVERPYEQIKLDLSHQGLGAILVSTGASFDASAEGRTHQAPADVAVLAALPDWDIHVPGHADELERQLRAAMKHDRPVYIRMSSQSNRSAHPSDGVTVVRRGTAAAATIVAVGPLLDEVVNATVGLDVSVVYTPTARPLDEQGLRTIAAAAPVVVVEPLLEGTSIGPVARALNDRPHRFLSIGVAPEELRRYGSPTDHAAAHGLDAPGIRRRLDVFLA